MNRQGGMISCGDCDHFTKELEVFDEGKCFYGTMENNKMVALVIPEDNAPCGLFTWKIDDESFISWV